jgi:hypothetical protein
VYERVPATSFVQQDVMHRFIKELCIVFNGVLLPEKPESNREGFRTMT